MFFTLPQFTQTPTNVGYGFGASVTQSGLYLLPSRRLVIVAPMTGPAVGPRGLQEVLVRRVTLRRLELPPPRAEPHRRLSIYAATALLGIASPWASRPWESHHRAVPRSRPAWRTGMNTNVRNIGAALGSGVARA